MPNTRVRNSAALNPECMESIFGAYAIIMRIAQTILAVVIAFAVALLPAAGSMALAAKATEAAVSAAAGAVPDCAHHHARAPADSSKAIADDASNTRDDCPPAKAMDDCGKMASCARCFLTVLPRLAPQIAHPMEQFALLSWPVWELVPPALSSPPFRPPRS